MFEKKFQVILKGFGSSYLTYFCRKEVVFFKEDFLKERFELNLNEGTKVLFN